MTMDDDYTPDLTYINPLSDYPASKALSILDTAINQVAPEGGSSIVKAGRVYFDGEHHSMEPLGAEKGRTQPWDDLVLQVTLVIPYGGRDKSMDLNVSDLEDIIRTEAKEAKVAALWNDYQEAQDAAMEAEATLLRVTKELSELGEGS